MSKLNVNRRDFLKLTASGVALASMGTMPAILRAEEAAKAIPPAGKTGTPKNIIFMVADGMAMGMPSLAEPFSRIVRNQGSTLADLLRQPEVSIGLTETRSLSSMVTDSSAASSAWGSGSRIVNAQVNILPDGTKLTPLAHLVKDSGRRVGLVTTTRITHATPAGFATVQERRDNEHLIAPQYLDVVDVLMGGGLKHFDPAKRKDKHDLVADFAAKGYTIWKDKAPALAAKDVPLKVLGLFADDHVPYTIDHINSDDLKAKVPTLAEMTRVALASLGKSEKGFLLQVEGGRVDHAGHGNDAAAMIWDQLAFDDAVAVALEFQQSHPDTLIIITTDHGTANPGLNGMGAEYKDSTECFETLAKGKASYDVIVDAAKAAGKGSQLDPVMMQDIIRSHLEITLTNDEATAVVQSLGGQPTGLNKNLRSFNGVLGAVLGNYNGIAFTGTNHTADDALLVAVGPGRERFAGKHKNVEAFKIMTNFFGIDHTNPSMTVEEAKKYVSYAPERREDDWA